MIFTTALLSLLGLGTVADNNADVEEPTQEVVEQQEEDEEKASLRDKVEELENKILELKDKEIFGITIGAYIMGTFTIISNAWIIYKNHQVRKTSVDIMQTFTNNVGDITSYKFKADELVKASEKSLYTVEELKLLRDKIDVILTNQSILAHTEENKKLGIADKIDNNINKVKENGTERN